MIHASFDEHREKILTERGGQLTYVEEGLLDNFLGREYSGKIVHVLKHLDQYNQFNLLMAQNKNKPSVSKAQMSNDTIKKDQHEIQRKDQKEKDNHISKKRRTNKQG